MADRLLFMQARLEAQAWLGPQASQVGLRVHCHLSLCPPRYNTSCGLVSYVTRPTHVLLATTFQLMVSRECRSTGYDGRHWTRRPHRCVILKLRASLFRTKFWHLLDRLVRPPRGMLCHLAYSASVRHVCHHTQSQTSSLAGSTGLTGVTGLTGAFQLCQNIFTQQ